MSWMFFCFTWRVKHNAFRNWNYCYFSVFEFIPGLLWSSCPITYIYRNIRNIAVWFPPIQWDAPGAKSHSLFQYIVSLTPVVISFLFLHACYMLLFHRNCTYQHWSLFSILAVAPGSFSKPLGAATGGFVTGGVLIQCCSLCSLPLLQPHCSQVSALLAINRPMYHIPIGKEAQRDTDNQSLRNSFGRGVCLNCFLWQINVHGPQVFWYMLIYWQNKQ